MVESLMAPQRWSIPLSPVLGSMLGYKVAERIKFDNQITLKNTDYPGLSGWA